MTTSWSNRYEQNHFIDGSENHQGTSFTSGIHLPLESLYKAPATGTKYFYYDTKDNSFGEK